tara:strand:+ start:4449 stop:6476 length:2028 start_codon:yes stop_codon:yes gene_type:complete
MRKNIIIKNKSKLRNSVMVKGKKSKIVKISGGKYNTNSKKKKSRKVKKSRKFKLNGGQYFINSNKKKRSKRPRSSNNSKKSKLKNFNKNLTGGGGINLEAIRNSGGNFKYVYNETTQSYEPVYDIDLNNRIVSITPSPDGNTITALLENGDLTKVPLNNIDNLKSLTSGATSIKSGWSNLLGKLRSSGAPGVGVGPSAALGPGPLAAAPGNKGMGPSASATPGPGVPGKNLDDLLIQLKKGLVLYNYKESELRNDEGLKEVIKYYFKIDSEDNKKFNLLPIGTVGRNISARNVYGKIDKENLSLYKAALMGNVVLGDFGTVEGLTFKDHFITDITKGDFSKEIKNEKEELKKEIQKKEEEKAKGTEEATNNRGIKENFLYDSIGQSETPELPNLNNEHYTEDIKGIYNNVVTEEKEWYYTYDYYNPVIGPVSNSEMKNEIQRHREGIKYIVENLQDELFIGKTKVYDDLVELNILKELRGNKPIHTMTLQEFQDIQKNELWYYKHIDRNKNGRVIINPPLNIKAMKKIQFTDQYGFNESLNDDNYDYSIRKGNEGEFVPWEDLKRISIKQKIKEEDIFDMTLDKFQKIREEYLKSSWHSNATFAKVFSDDKKDKDAEAKNANENNDLLEGRLNKLNQIKNLSKNIEAKENEAKKNKELSLEDRLKELEEDTMAEI